MSETWPEIHLHFHAAPETEAMDILRRLDQQGVTVMADLDALTTAVQNATTVDQSAIALIQQLADEIRANASDPAAIQALADQLQGNTDALAAALVANTPAAAATNAPQEVSGDSGAQ